MSQQFPGGFITYANLSVSNTTASGVWTLDQQMQYKRANSWPTAIIFITTAMLGASGMNDVISYKAPIDTISYNEIIVDK